MRGRGEDFTRIVRTALAVTPLRTLLETGHAVVLEHIAYGAGQTNWYYCQDRAQLDVIEGMLLPGSVVSFYFDGRLGPCPWKPALVGELEAIIVATYGAVLGWLAEDGMTIDATQVVSRGELAEIAATLAPSSQVFCGAFPARDNDGARAVTMTVPDLDGIVRPHPH